MNDSIPQCGCKATRKCYLCAKYDILLENDDEKKSLFDINLIFCNSCKKCFHSSAYHNCGDDGIPFYGISVLRDFVSINEETILLENIEAKSWMLSQSGRRKQDFGPKINFKHKKVRIGEFKGLPIYSKFIVERINSFQPCNWQKFRPVELCNLEYDPLRGSCIVPHLDDLWIWGERLITLNLLSDTIITFSLPNIAEHNEEISRFLSEISKKERTTYNNICVEVTLPRRSLLIVDGSARYLWLHEIRRKDINKRRIAMTFRELSKIFTPDDFTCLDANQKIGYEILSTAESYNGT